MAYYENKDELHLQLQSAHNDIADVTVLVGEVSGNNNDSWRYESFFMQKTFATRYHDYWEVTLKLNKNEAQYVFKVTDTYGNVGLMTPSAYVKLRKKMLIHHMDLSLKIEI